MGGLHDAKTVENELSWSLPYLAYNGVPHGDCSALLQLAVEV
jgi:hypothetical protein